MQLAAIFEHFRYLRNFIQFLDSFIYTAASISAILPCRGLFFKPERSRSDQCVWCRTKPIMATFTLDMDQYFLHWSHFSVCGANLRVLQVVLDLGWLDQSAENGKSLSSLLAKVQMLQIEGEGFPRVSREPGDHMQITC